MTVEESNGSIGDEYVADVREKLRSIFLLEKDYSVTFDEWLEQELKPIEEEEIKKLKNSDSL